MTSSTYLRYEVLRNFRNWRFLFLSLAFPLVLYFSVASANRHATFSGIAFTIYFMAAMATLGTMASVVSSAVVIAADRSAGWTRQMRITPLTVGAYFGSRLLNGYLRAVLTIVLVCLAGTALGVRLSATEWLTPDRSMTSAPTRARASAR
jgi:ABC-2 type transport system permease protein